MRTIQKSIRLYSVLLLVACPLLLVAVPIGAVMVAQEEVDSLAGTTDVYYQTEGVPSGPSAKDIKSVYPRLGFLDNRVVVWVVTQQHTYFGGFVLALPFFCVLLEFLGLRARDPVSAQRYDILARDVLKIALLALSFTAILGSGLLALLILFYPSFMNYMGGTFKSMMPMYAGVFLGECLLLIAYYYSWQRLASQFHKWIHLSVGIVVNAMGVALLLLANSWASFMMAPSGVDADGRFLGNMWHLLHSPLWNPLNAHRFLADLMSGGAVVVAYAVYRYFTSRSDEERAYYDWVGYVFLLVVVCALLPMPFAGYWLMRTVFEFRQSMGMTMMGGLLSWLFVVQAITVGVLFLGINYYIWQSMGRIPGGERYQPYFKVIVYALVACFLVWFTPHTLAMSASEMKAVGAAQHPVIGYFGVMSAKNGAINVMICLTALSYLLYRRANRIVTVSWAKAGNFTLMALFGVGMAHIIWLAIYGFYLPANTRVGLAVPQVATTATVLIVGLWLNRAMLHGAQVIGPIQWGKISVRGMVILFGVAAAFTWVMGLMGYIRSAGRVGWHVSELLPDVSPWAHTPAIGFVAKMVTLNMMIFWVSVFVIFWLSPRDRSHGAEEQLASQVKPVSLVPMMSREGSSS